MMLQNLQQPVMLENQQEQVIFAAPPSQDNNLALKIVAIVAGLMVFFVIISVVLAGVLYVWASDLANNTQEDSPEEMYQYSATDHSDAVDSSTEDTLFVLQFSRAPKDLNWANLNIQITGADGNLTTCNIDAGDGNCKMVQFGSDDQTWEKWEIVHVTENGQDICSAAPCSLTIKISDVRSGVDLAGSGSVVVE
jgi:FlaG/FlaF family flagellin (archaellin)